MAASAAAAGTIVGGRYQLVRLLGAGGMGAVWEGRHLRTRRLVAIKFLDSARGLLPEARRRFLREARAASAIRHPNVLPIDDVVEEPDEAPALVMELLHGETLSQRIARVGRLSLPETARLLRPVASAMAAVHAAGVVHRDLKPGNLFLVERPGGGVEVRVLDFGIAKLTAAHGDAATTGDLTRTAEILGTPYYMAPEQAFGAATVDHRADIWALGVVLYECLGGIRPFVGDNVGQIFRRVLEGAAPIGSITPGLPAALAAMVDQMLLEEVSRRPSRMSDIEEVLARYAGDGGAATPSSGERTEPAGEPVIPIALLSPAGPANSSGTAPPRRTGRARWLAMVALGSVGVTGAIGWIVGREPARRDAPAAQQSAPWPPSPASPPPTAPPAPLPIAPALSPSPSPAPATARAPARPPIRTRSASTEKRVRPVPSSPAAAPRRHVPPGGEPPRLQRVDDL